jgi:hypothetical protein
VIFTRFGDRNYGIGCFRPCYRDLSRYSDVIEYFKKSFKCIHNASIVKFLTSEKELHERCTVCTPVRVRDNLQQVHSFHAMVFLVFYMWNEVQFFIKDEAKEFEFITDRYGNAIQSERCGSVCTVCC